MESFLELVTNITPSILAAGTSITSYYKEKQVLVTFIVSVVKAFMIIVSFSYVAYLYFGKNQQVKQTLLWMILIEKSLTLIFVLVGIYLTYNKNKEVIKEQAIKLKSDVKEKLIKKKILKKND
jgi:ABC-type nickel/cobalt efflux system permease component RcnA